MPVVGALIGYFTNWTAIKLLFLPRKKVFGIQGVVPKRKAEIAEKIAEASLYFLPGKIEKLAKMPFIGKKITDYIKKEVEKKARAMDNEKLQEIIERTSNRELKFIIISGGVLGFIIGLIQALIIELI